MYFSKLKSLPSTIRIDELELTKTGELPKLKVYMLLSAFVMPGKPIEKTEEYQGKHYVYDPFFRPEAGVIATQPKTKQVLTLLGIWRGKENIAFINDKAVGVSQYINGYKVVKIEEKKVILEKEGRTYTLGFGGIR